jgi:hypothetical protein
MANKMPPENDAFDLTRFSLALYGTNALSAYDQRYPSQDFNLRTRHKLLCSDAALRSCTRYAPEDNFTTAFVIETAAYTYFRLLDNEKRQLSNSFSERDIEVILNTNCGPVWEFDPYMSLATAVADDNGVSNLEELPADSQLRTLLESLLTLTPLQNAAVVDACEVFWRNGRDKSLTDAMLFAGLVLRLA